MERMSLLKNLVLIGMPGSGKSTAGALVAQALGLTLVETDALVETRAGCSISELFTTRGEAHFRDIETMVALAVAQGSDAVVSTGGGMVLRPENMEALGRTGYLLFLDRPPEAIAGENHSDRPLLAGNLKRVFTLYEERIGLYRRYGQYLITAGNSPAETAERILELATREGFS